MDKKKTQIRFVIFGGELLAVFMGRAAGLRYNAHSDIYLRGIYAHVGQHGEGYDGIQRRKRATPEQYRALKAELESIGYNVEVR